mmetsp:Transcript_59382/g.97793  ORF Transcript_59382/g.97793 Transcript_59382/m.97793 type:complete len:381 (-) Transcript_59382:979-2121(-)
MLQRRGSQTNAPIGGDGPRAASCRGTCGGLSTPDIEGRGPELAVLLRQGNPQFEVHGREAREDPGLDGLGLKDHPIAFLGPVPGLGHGDLARVHIGRQPDHVPDLPLPGPRRIAVVPLGAPDPVQPPRQRIIPNAFPRVLVLHLRPGALLQRKAHLRDAIVGRNNLELIVHDAATRQQVGAARRREPAELEGLAAKIVRDAARLAPHPHHHSPTGGALCLNAFLLLFDSDGLGLRGALGRCGSAPRLGGGIPREVVRAIPHGLAPILRDHRAVGLEQDEGRDAVDLEKLGEAGLEVATVVVQGQPLVARARHHAAEVLLEAVLVGVRRDEHHLELLAGGLQRLVALHQLRREPAARGAPVRAEVEANDALVAQIDQILVH